MFARLIAWQACGSFLICESHIPRFFSWNEISVLPVRICLIFSTRIGDETTLLPRHRSGSTPLGGRVFTLQPVRRSGFPESSSGQAGRDSFPTPSSFMKGRGRVLIPFVLSLWKHTKTCQISYLQIFIIYEKIWERVIKSRS